MNQNQQEKMAKWSELQRVLQENQQSHLWAHAESLDEDKKEAFLEQCALVDWSLMFSLYQKMAYQKEVVQEQKVSPLPGARLSEQTATDRKKWADQGLQLIRENKCALILVAGGQGSRLGFEGPKGMYQLDIPSKSSLFEVFALQVAAWESQFNVQIPWCVMTGPQNDQETRAFFAKHQNWGCKSVHFFVQGVVPAINTQGKALLENEGLLALVPDGNGGCFKAWQKSGLMKKCIENGSEYVFVFGVDNILCPILSPEFLGFALDQSALSASLTVSKKNPEERVGVFCAKDGKPAVIEYSDLADDLRFKTNPLGQLEYGFANLAIHLFKIDALVNALSQELPWHKAFKKVSYWSVEDRKQISPVESNAYKFELFMFDVFEFFPQMALLEVVREEVFAPLKNAEGSDSPHTAKSLYLNEQKRRMKLLGLNGVWEGDWELLSGVYLPGVESQFSQADLVNSKKLLHTSN